MASTAFAFAAKLAKDGDGFVVSFRDLPEALTQGEDRADALAQAADCLDEAIAGRITRGEAIPSASRPKRGERVVAVPPVMAAKAALYVALREARISKLELARRLGCDQKDMRRLLDPRYASKIGAIADALRSLGKASFSTSATPRKG
jgi:antitoxin HicB